MYARLFKYKSIAIYSEYDDRNFFRILYTAGISSIQRGWENRNVVKGFEKP